MPIVQLESSLDLQVRERQMRLHDELAARHLDVVVHDRRLAVHGHAGCGLLRRRRAEDVEAQVVSHDAGEQRRIDVGAVGGMLRPIVGPVVDRRPGRRPERIDALALVEDFRDVATLGEDGHAQRVVLNRHRAAALVGMRRMRGMREMCRRHAAYYAWLRARDRACVPAVRSHLAGQNTGRLPGRMRLMRVDRFSIVQGLCHL